jgi:glycosyltransferase involved in cell wall biosynthesis
LFAKTLPTADFDAITRADYRVMELPWNGLHRGALMLRHLRGRPVYARWDTSEFDVLVAETPFPARVSGRTRLVVRYHDAIPVLMPHSIKDREHHQRSHYEALRRNVEDGAWFACVSDATRRDLLSMFPQAEAKSVTIPNMVSHHYREESAPPQRVPDILLTRRHRAVGKRKKLAKVLSTVPRYLLMVSTVEPRKNHLALLGAWERLRSAGHPDLQLVVVGALGWDHEFIVPKFSPWVKRGVVHLLEDVPAADLRLLYRHAEVTVCPSFGEGFDFSGVEAMRSGGVVAASDIQVHQDVYEDAAEYFSPYTNESLFRTLSALLGEAGEARRARLAARGAVVSARYLPEQVLPQWQAFFNRLSVES